MAIPTKKSSPKKKKNRVKLSPEEREKKKTKERLHKDVMSVFKYMGFEYLRTDGKHKTFGGQVGEIDFVFLYQNIVLIVEETIAEVDKNHIRTKNFFYDKIKENFDEFIAWLQEDYFEKFSKFSNYSNHEYKFYYIYISSGVIDREVKELFSSLVFIDSKSLKYFTRISSSLKLTSRLELYKFLGINLEDVGHAESHTLTRNIETAIILPESGYGFPSGVQVVTFVMKAKELLECAYVLRKDSWDSSVGTYQRLIDKEKIEKIRRFLAEKGRTFVNNIIVTLPIDATFSELDSVSKLYKPVNIFTVRAVSNVTVTLKYKLNSIGIIDGQHRVFSHYEGNDSLEPHILKLRNMRHLLVTGLYFDSGKFSEAERRKFESELFLQINSEQKKVEKSLLQYIESLQDPYSAIGIANNVLESLNERSPFLNLFVLSQFDKSGIKTPTILQYGLQVLVNPDANDNTLYKYWVRQTGLNLKSAKNSYEEYILFCTTNISTYFGALKATFPTDWNLKDSRLLSVTPIVAFTLAYKKSLERFDGPQDFDFYKNKFKSLKVDFKQKPFIYTSSQWNSLVAKIDLECWS